MLSYKRGKSHARDLGAALEIIRFDLATGKIVQDPIKLGIPGKIMQMGEWIQFPNGKLATFIDAQEVDKQGKHARIGLQQAVSNDTGKTFSSLKRVGLIDGVEYGYLFDSVTIVERVYALVMTFEYLDGGRRSVDVVFTDDNGAGWHFVRNLSHEFGDISINESSFIAYKHGFIVATRGYDEKQRLHTVSKSFELIRETNLTDSTPHISSYFGRPRIFLHAGNYFLIGRNHRGPRNEYPMELGMVRFDPDTLTIEKQFVLDNIEQGKVTDGYYPCPIIVKQGDQEILNVFDYKAILRQSPDIVRFQFHMDAFIK
jgi:hypothetical protein